MNLFQNLALKYSHIMMEKSLEKGFNVELLKEPKEKIPKEDKTYMLYTHIPFCHTFCPYCSFHKYYYDEELAKIYFENLRKEIILIKEKGFNFTSMYVGGGTTLIHEEELLKTLELCKKIFDIKEISCETDPNHIKPEKLSMFKGIIDRLSCGVQSFNDDILKKVARYNKFGSSQMLQEKISKAMNILPIFSIDLIFNLPGQTIEQLLNDLTIAKSLAPQQITTYPLMKSGLTKDNIAKSLGVSIQDNEFKFYQIIRDFFKDYQQNNGWSFSLEKNTFNDEYVSSHHEYLGVGSGAFSFLDGELLINAFDLNDYSKLIKEKQNANIAKANFDKKEIIKYVFLTEIFAGKIDIERFNKTLNCNLEKELFIELLGLKISGAIKKEGNFLTTSKFGQYLFVVLMKDFYTGMDLVRAVFRDNQRIKNKNFIDIMKENVNPLEPASMEFKAN
ncbi:coproporphyrinogen III oxidase family protein [Campylobacter molothri]|uniref:coproporphyrinogen III oxidase family protein n=1 Tax=Campylobacter molothri TaxID=1032242 RepID=UPI001ED6B61D|nr:coproporphyrinogen III oxidase family protein [Campylobacter sp. RM10535]